MDWEATATSFLVCPAIERQWDRRGSSKGSRWEVRETESSEIKVKADTATVVLKEDA